MLLKVTILRTWGEYKVKQESYHFQVGIEQWQMLL